MPATPATSLTGDVRLLLNVPKNAIVEFLLSPAVNHEDLGVAYRRVFNAHEEVSHNALVELSRADLIHVFQSCHQLPKDAARHLHDEYRYRGMKSLYIYDFSSLKKEVTTLLEIAQLNAILSMMESRAQHQDVDFSDVRVRDIEEIKTAVGALSELSYSYIAPVQIVDPQTEYPKVVNDLRTGFVWLHHSERWLVICARDEAINNLLVKALTEHFNCSPLRLSIPKSVLRSLEPFERIRRASLLDPSTRTRRRWTNPAMVSDNAALEEIRTRDQRDDRTTSGYNEELPDGTVFALGFSSDRGRLFFSKDLTVSQMREWGPRKISELVAAIRAIRANNPTELMPAAANDLLKRMLIQTRETIEHIALAVVKCKIEGLSEILLSVDSIAVLQALGNRVSVFIQVQCDTCEEASEIRCEVCQGTNIRLYQDYLRCSNCQHQLSLNQIFCTEGHRNILSTVSDLVGLVPTSNLLEIVAKLIVTISNHVFNINEEFFHMRGNRLFYGDAGDQVIYLLHEIPEFDTQIPEMVPANAASEIRSALAEFREAYSCRGTENCVDCVAVRRHEKCYLRLFGLLDPSYTPRPHHGQEFGDYSRPVTLSGRSGKQLVVAMKSACPSSRAVTLRDRLGRDLYTQVAGYFRNATIDAVGICVPRKLEEGFRALLRWNAQLASKKLVLIDDETLVQIVYAVMQQQGISLDDI